MNLKTFLFEIDIFLNNKFAQKWSHKNHAKWPFHCFGGFLIMNVDNIIWTSISKIFSS